MNTDNDALILRLAGADDGPAIRRLAELDEAPPPDGLVLLALIGAEAVAAVSLDDGRAVADPFVPTAGALALLRLRAAHLSAGRPRNRRGGRARDRRGWRRPLRRAERIGRPLRPRAA